MTEWPAFLSPTLVESILSECIQLLTLTTCLQALVAHDAAPVALQGAGHVPQPSSAGAKENAIKVVKGHDVLTLVCSNLNGIVDRLEMLSLRHRADSGSVVAFTQFQDIGDVVPFPDQEILAERARIAGAMNLIGQFNARALARHYVHGGVHVPIDRAESPGTCKEVHAQQSVGTLNRAIDQLSEAAYNLFQLSDHCT